jgi:hypothetical protein
MVSGDHLQHCCLLLFCLSSLDLDVLGFVVGVDLGVVLALFVGVVLDLDLI